MIIIDISEGPLKARISPECGALIDSYYNGIPIVRPFTGDIEGQLSATKAASFPLVPFCNRVEGNIFVYEGRKFRLKRNTDWDRSYLHGEGWISEWEVAAKGDNWVTMTFLHMFEEGAPYSYCSEQTISVQNERLRLSLSVTNKGDYPMPFGLGHHMFFPKSSNTTLQANAESYWSEKQDYLPDKRGAVPEKLDFHLPKNFPRGWINNGFDGWDGRAVISWPERSLGVAVLAEKPFDNYFIFQSDTDFEPDFKDDYFCFEPMTHTVNAHLLPDYAGLVRLAPGDTLETEVSIEPFRIPGDQ